MHVEAVRAAAPFLRGESLNSLLEELSPQRADTVAEYDPAFAYSVGQRVRLDGRVYVSLADANTGQTPAYDSDYWETALSAAIRQLYTDTVQEALSHLVTEQITTARHKVQLFRQPLFKQATISSLMPSDGFFRCVEFTLPALKDVRFNLLRVGLRSTEAQTIPFYLYHSSQTEPLAQFDVRIEPSQAEKWEWIDLPADPAPLFTMWHLSPGHNAAGRFYFGYYEDHLTADLYSEKQIPFPVTFCTGLRVRGCVFSSEQTDPPQLPQLGQWLDGPVWSEDITFNTELEMRTDYTHLFLENLPVLAKAVQHELAVRLLEAARNSSRLNREKTNLEQKLAAVLDDRIVADSRGMPKTEKGLISVAQDYRSQVRLDMLPGKSLLSNSFS